jgi:Holliday junction resolvasome RuvABC endonuclease subunit
MRVLGVDPSSTLCGLAVADRNVLQEIHYWKPADEKDSQEARLYQWFTFLDDYIMNIKPDLVAFEQVQSARNMNTIRALARFEAAAIILAKDYGAIAMPVSVSTGRKIVLGRGNIDKEDAYIELKKRYPEFTWLAKTRGGMDQSDATVMALAGPTVLERR